MVVTKLFSAALLLLLLSACAVSGRNPLRTLEDYEKRFAARETPCPLTPRKKLTLAEAQEIALANNPDYLAAYDSVQAARARYYRTLSAYLPRVDLGSSASQTFTRNHHRVNPPDDIFYRERNFTPEFTLSASWLLFDGFAREFSVIIAKQDFIQTRALDENTKRLLLRAVAYAYYDAVLAEQAAGIAESDLAFQVSSLAQAENRRRAGFVSLGPVLNFKILANEAKSAMLNARCRRAASRYALAALMGLGDVTLPDGMPLGSTAIRRDPDLPPVRFYLEKAVELRPDLRAVRAALEQARLRKYRAASSFLPTLNLFASGGLERSQSRIGGGTHQTSSWNGLSFEYGVALNWNLFDGFATLLSIREYAALEKKSARELEKTWLDAVSEVKTAYANYSNAYQQVLIYHEMLEWVFEQRSLVAAEYWAGNNTITRLNGAQSDLVNAELRLASSLAEMGRYEAQLRAAVNLPSTPVPMRDFPMPDSGTGLEKLLEQLDRRFP